MQTKSCSNNLIVYGLEERSDIAYQVYGLLSNQLELDTDRLSIENISRIGKPAGMNSNFGRKKRAVKVEFRYQHQGDRCMANCSKLSGSNIAVDRDYPIEIQQARKRLWPKFKRLRAQHRGAVQFLFSAAISVSGVIKFDEFPQLDHLVNGHRPPVNPITQPTVTASSQPATLT